VGFCSGAYRNSCCSNQAKAREEVAARVASKIRGETKRVQEITEHEKGVRSARNEYERVQTVLKEAENEVSL
jgi:hypothetical protein